MAAALRRVWQSVVEDPQGPGLPALLVLGPCLLGLGGLLVAMLAVLAARALGWN